MAKEIVSVNLLDNKEKSIGDRFLYWAMYVGRLLIILTEAVALFVFGSRFSLDRTLVDLHDEIKSNQMIVDAFREREQTYRRVQQQLAVANKAEAPTQKNILLFTDIVKLTNYAGITLANVSINANKVEIAVEATSSQGLALFVEKLKTNPAIASVAVEKIENRRVSSLIVVLLSATRKGAEGGQP